MSKKNTPPSLIYLFLAWMLGQKHTSLLGDMEEEFNELVKIRGLMRAKWYYFSEAILLIPYVIIDTIRQSTVMLKNYFITSVRNTLRHKVFSLINTLGLALGVVCTLLIFLYVNEETSYDKFHEHADKIYRVRFDLDLNGVPLEMASLQFPAANVLVNDYPEVEQAVRIYKEEDPYLIRFEEEQHLENKLLFVDSNFFELFSFELLSGNQKNVLAKPNSVVITEKMALKYFGTIKAIGNTLIFQNGESLEVTGVVSNNPGNTHFTFDFLIPMEFQLAKWKSISGLDGRENKWFWNGTWTYLLLSDRQKAEELESKLPQFVETYFPDRYKDGTELTLQPLTDIYLHSQLNNEIEPTSSALYIYIFSAVALFVLAIASINFTNLTTARLTNRLKEIGMRKALGASTRQLRLQLISEAIFTSLGAVFIGAVLVYLFLPGFSALISKPLSIAPLLSVKGIVAIVAFAIALGFMSGFYPAFIYSGANPVSSLKDLDTPGSKSNYFRQGLVVLQFAISITLMISIGMIYKQMEFINDKKLGFNEENIVIVDARNSIDKQFDTYRNELMKAPGIVDVAGTTNIPGAGIGSWRFVPEGFSMEDPLMLPMTSVNEHFLNTLDIEISMGRWFSKDHPSDLANGFVINEKALELLGWGKESDTIGKTMQLFGPGTSEIIQSGQIIGVIKDYHFESLHHEISPLVITAFNSFEYYAVKVKKENIAESLEYITATTKDFAPAWPVNYFFLDQNLDQLYKNEQKMGKTMTYFTVLALIIAVMGLFGLSMFTLNKRNREIGIRKVYGASFFNLTRILSTGFLKPVILGFLIATPIAYYLMNWWLQNFAYQAELSIDIFIAACLSTIGVAFLTVSYQLITMARKNPIETLRTE